VRVFVRDGEQPQDPHQDRARGQDSDSKFRSATLPRFSATKSNFNQERVTK